MRERRGRAGNPAFRGKFIAVQVQFVTADLLWTRGDRRWVARDRRGGRFRRTDGKAALLVELMTWHFCVQVA